MIHKVKYDRPGECSPEKDCLDWRTDMIQQTKRKPKQKNNWKLKISDMLAMKTNKVDKINPFHIKMLLGQIIETEETGYVRIVTEYEKVNTLITPSQLYSCTVSNM